MPEREQATLSTQSILARLERLPITSWHVRARMIAGAATFFDAFDVLTISVVLPVLAGAWRLRAMVYSIALFAFMSLACAVTWNYTSLFICRTIQGIGLGGEVPVAAAY